MSKLRNASERVGVVGGAMVLAAIGTFLLAAGPAEGQTEDADPIRQETHVYKTIGERELVMDVYSPAAAPPEGGYPAIVFFFGGGWRKGDRAQFEYQCQHLASLGMVAATADYRVKDRDGVLPDACVEDAKSAVRWMRAHHQQLQIDPARLAAGGGSAGGHIAACTAFTDGLDRSDEDQAVSSRPNALVLFNPVLDFMEGSRYANRLEGDEVLARQISPNEHIAAGAPPAILFYGEEDKLVAEGQTFVDRMTAAGNRAEIYISPGDGHGFFNRPPYLEETFALAVTFLTSIGYLDPHTDE